MTLYNFGLSQEDERTEAAALGVGGGRGRVLSVASAGEVPLSLLAMGADRVTAVDVDAGQLHLVWLKLAAATHLAREDAVRFLGYLPAPGARRRAWLGDVAPALPPATAVFWRAHPDAVTRGAIWAGRFERYIRPLAAVAVPLFGRRRIEGLLSCSSLEEQESHFERAFRPTALRALFRVVFHPRLYRRRGMDPRGLSQRTSQESLGDQFLGWFRALCTATPARENHLLQLFVLGHVLDANAVPAYLAPDSHARFRSSADRLEVVHADVASFLRGAAPGRFDAAHLSNIPDWMGPAEFDDVLTLLCDKLDHPARVIWRALHVDRPVPDRLAGRLQVDLPLGQDLRRRDRFPFYRLVPAVIP